ncbi:MAG: TIGR00282 family metallophosphoesterase [Candidatus Muirbacterium halophilum]|nr:TIGR00282 family metallophosphoesterase [Candidatus Muirbacterium halophilum]MCK9475939.1 TIGR00282 family metallophosphoesterase [Candidatus Muirbacterium halophilum]
MRILFVGDIDDTPGLEAASILIPKLKNEFEPDIIIVNGENAANGIGLDKKSAKIIIDSGADVITLGNHTWSNKEIYDIIDDPNYSILRPLNFPGNNPGKGYIIKNTKKGDILVVNAHGQESIVNILGKEIFSHMESPFHSLDVLVEKMKDKVKFIFIDFHAEATIEKMALGRFLDGRVSAIVGTHTHVTTADETIMSGGTAYITDVGMTGDIDSVAGCVPIEVIEQYRTIRPTRWRGATGDPVLNGVIIDVDDNTGKALKIFRVKRKLLNDIEELKLPNEFLANLMNKLVNMESIDETGSKIVNVIMKKCNIPIGAFIEKSSVGLNIRYSNINEREFALLEKSINENCIENNCIVNGFNIISFKDNENPNLLYNIVLKSYKKVILDPVFKTIIINLYGKLRKEKLLMQTNDELSVLYEIGRDISKTIELYGEDGLLNKIMKITTKVMQAESSSIILYDEGMDDLFFVVGIGEKGDAVKKVRLKKNQGIAGWVLQNGESAIVPDTSKDGRFFGGTDKETEYKTNSLIAIPMKIHDKVIGVLEVLNRIGEIPFNEKDLMLLENIANQAAYAIHNGLLFDRIKSLYKSIVELLANTMDSKDSYTHGHSRRVAEYSVKIAKVAGFNEKFVQDIEIAALLHDIGKIGIRDAILCKPGALTSEEYEIIKDHPVISAKIIEPVDFLKNLTATIKHHHEKYDGTGYPDGIKGEDIPVGARIIAVGDAFDAMTSDRPYRKGMDAELAFEELEKNKGTQFDPVFVDYFIKIYKKQGKTAD